MSSELSPYRTPSAWPPKRARERSESSDIAEAIAWADPNQVDEGLWLPDLPESREWLPDELLVRKVHYEILGAFKAFGLQRHECELVLSPKDWESLKLGSCTRLFGMAVSQWEGTSKPLLEYNGTYYPSARM